jgi:predicted small lipoprotein YifL
MVARDDLVSQGSYTVAMSRFALLAGRLVLSIAGLAACGLKGDLYEPEPETESESAPPLEGDWDPGERRTIPREPDPAQAK